ANLHELAYNLWWSWNPDAQEIFHELSPFFWEHSHHNPVEVLNWVSGQELRGRLEQPDLHAKVQKVCTRFKEYLTARETWVTTHAPSLQKGLVAYFSAEFGLHECLHVYSGGLGILAGDHAKSASDLGLPFVGVSLFYRQGYFQQQISDDGWQQERYPADDPLRLPIRLVTGTDGSPLVSSVEVDHAMVYFQAWVVHVGRARVYLLDSNLPQNEQRFRDLTAHVYGGDQTNRIGQELLLGIGGVRLLRAMGLSPTVFHMNEGHAAFLTLELLREQLAQNSVLAEAERYVKSECVFTTHTPVPAGHDRFDRGLMEANLRRFSSSLGMTVEQVMRYGRINQDDPNETFTMTVLALRFSRSANGVSELHGKTSAEMWKDLYPGIPLSEVPIGHITNGVHITGWTAPTAGAFWNLHLGEQWNTKLQDREFWEKGLDPKSISDADLWQLRNRLRRELIEFVRRRLREQHLRNKGFDPGIFESVLAPDVLTIGFARRFATYKRAPLFFRDLTWALRMLNHPERRVQIVFAGKAHPRDDAGKHFIQQIVNQAKREDLFGRVVFIEDYDIDVARHLVAGADVWLNTPRRPMEACGTSGEKTLIHGGLHLSTMDGWWREAFDGSNGWSIGEDAPYENETVQDDRDAASLRAVIVREVVPLFYDRGRDGLPHAWLKRVRHSMSSLIPIYNTERMVAEYITKYYLQHAKSMAGQQV
ncbi:MAG: alpha-glucan family phosphorylase, partial [Ignavibacteria bacterium]|nr:alpha-glucan family phosphorylase [Ignavibacteria bacterium]